MLLFIIILLSWTLSDVLFTILFHLWWLLLIGLRFHLVLLSWITWSQILNVYLIRNYILVFLISRSLSDELTDSVVRITWISWMLGIGGSFSTVGAILGNILETTYNRAILVIHSLVMWLLVWMLLLEKLMNFKLWLVEIINELALIWFLCWWSLIRCWSCRMSSFYKLGHLFLFLIQLL